MFLANANLLLTDLGQHHIALGHLSLSRENQSGMSFVQDPLTIGTQNIVGFLFHIDDLAAHKGTGSHQLGGQMLLAVFVHLSRNAFLLHLIGNLDHFRLRGLSATVHHLIANKQHRSQNHNNRDNVDHIQSLLCFLFHIDPPKQIRDDPLFPFLWTMFAKHCIIFFMISQDHFL